MVKFANIYNHINLILVNLMTTNNQWHVYLLRCSDNSLYCGITTDLIRRVKEHNTSVKGAKYTKTRRPVSLVYSEYVDGRSEACKLEAKIKKMPKTKKELLVADFK